MKKTGMHRRLLSAFQSPPLNTPSPAEIIPPTSIVIGFEANSVADFFESASFLFPEALAPSQEISQRLTDREALMSTALGLGVAMPHTSIPGTTTLSARLFLLKRPIIWPAFDQVPVDVVVCTLFSETDRATYLTWVSAVAAILRDETTRRELRAARTSEEAWSALFGEER